MQSQHNRKSAYLFQVLLDREQLNELIHIDESLLIKLIQHCSKHYIKVNASHRKQIYFFLANYKNIMQLHSKVIKSITSVNLSLHFALLFTHDLLRQLSMQLASQNQYAYAKIILKQVEQYLPLEGIDLILLAACMNNLALLHLKSAKPKKALASCLSGISVMQEHLNRLHIMRNKRRMIEDGVIFVNLLLIAKKSLNHILKECRNDIKIYKKLLKMINRLGYNFSIKYLGATSIFTSKFQVDINSIDLPVYDQSISDHSEVQSARNEFELKITQELKNIYQMLKDMKLEPEVYYIKQHLVEPKDSQQSIQVIEEIPSHEPQRSVSHMEHIIIDDWDTQFSILKTNELSLDKQYEYLGHLQFRLIKGKKNRQKIITEDAMFKILHTINIYDILPYEMELKRLSSQDFTKRLLLGFLIATDEGQLKIFPRAKPVIPPFELRFCGEKSFIFVNHVRFRKFRVAICPVNSCETMYLQVDFKHKQTDDLFKLKQIDHPFIAAYSKKHHPDDNYTVQYTYSTYKTIQILSSNFANKINRILKEFQTFLTEEEENRLTDMSTVINFSENYLYYQYTEFKDNIGQFHLLKYRSNINHIEISIKNIFQTYTPAGKEYARGTVIYSPQHFIRDFSIPLKASKRFLGAFCQLILQKFSLKIYSSPLLQEEEDLYEQNAIIQVPITSKCYSRRFLSFEGYILPITIEVIAVNNQKPIGIRITAYEPIKGTHSGLFIHITPQYWERPALKEEAVQEDSINSRVKKSTQDYNFKKGYFLTSWMEEQGFQLIFERLEIANRALELRGINSKFVRLDGLL